jgi:hypothetical protein
MTANGLMGKVRERSDATAAAWADSLLSHPALARLVQGLAEARSGVDRGTRRALHLLGLASHDDYAKAAEVLSRSGRKLADVERNLSRIEALLDGMKALPVAITGPRPARPARSIAPRARPAERLAARPALVKPMPAAKPTPARPAADLPRTFAPPAKTATKPAAKKTAPARRISEIALAAAPGSAPAKAAAMLAGFGPASKGKK